jgi:prophage maintenance system killer protein
MTLKARSIPREGRRKVLGGNQEGEAFLAAAANHYCISSPERLLCAQMWSKIAALVHSLIAFHPFTDGNREQLL